MGWQAEKGKAKFQLIKLLIWSHGLKAGTGCWTFGRFCLTFSKLLIFLNSLSERLNWSVKSFAPLPNTDVKFKLMRIYVPIWTTQQHPPPPLHPQVPATCLIQWTLWIASAEAALQECWLAFQRHFSTIPMASARRGISEGEPDQGIQPNPRITAHNLGGTG